MKPFFIGIAGGSGTGKTALATALKKKLGKKASILHLDNYQRFGQKLPMVQGMKNWDHPKAVNWDKLHKDLVALKNEQKIIIKARNQKRLNLKENSKMTSFAPTEIVIIEGYLLFCKSFIRRLLDFLIYLDTSDKVRINRRTKFKNHAYIKKILLPMHRKYIEPMKKYADLILDTGKYSIKHCCQKIIASLDL